MTIKYISATLLFTLFLFSLSCSQLANLFETNTETPVEPIKIGLLQPVTGPDSYYGAESIRAAKIAIDTINAAGGLLGKRLDYRIEDTKSEDQTAADAAQRLIDLGAIGIIGPVGPDSALAAYSKATVAGIPMISGAASSPALSTISDEGVFFRTTGSDATQGTAAADRIMERGYTTIGILHVDTSFGTQLKDAFLEQLDSNHTITAIVSYPDPRLSSQNSYTAELDQLFAKTGTSTVAPDIVFGIMYPGEAAIILNEWSTGDYGGTWFFPESCRFETLAQELTPETVALMEGTAITQATGNTAVSFKSDYLSTYGVLPSPLCYNTYDAVILLALAIEAAQSFTGADILQALPEVSASGTPVYGSKSGLQQALSLIAQGQDIDYEGASGPVDFDSNGDVISPLEIWYFDESGAIKQKKIVMPD